MMMKTFVFLFAALFFSSAQADQLLICSDSSGNVVLTAGQNPALGEMSMSFQKPMELIKPGIPRHPETDEFVTINVGVSRAGAINSLIVGQICDIKSSASLEPVYNDQFRVKLECESSNGYSSGTYAQNYYTSLKCQ